MAGPQLAGFVPEAGFELTASWFLAWCLHHCIKLTLSLLFVLGLALLSDAGEGGGVLSDMQDSISIALK